MLTPIRFYQATIDTTIALRKSPNVIKFQIVGSTLIEGVEAKDLDFLVLADAHNFDTAATLPVFDDYRMTVGNGAYADVNESWGSLRNGDVNLIVTTDPEWYERAVVANEVVVALQLKDKADRIVVYRVVRDKYDADGANARRDGRA